MHPIITRGGDLVNVIPSDVTLETYVRGKTTDAIDAAAAKVDRALKAGALALGAEVEIITLPGYLPLINDQDLAELFLANQRVVHGEPQARRQGHRTGSTDMGDVSHIMPALHPSMAGAVGSNHAVDWMIDDPHAGQRRWPTWNRPRPWPGWPPTCWATAPRKRGASWTTSNPA